MSTTAQLWLMFAFGFSTGMSVCTILFSVGKGR